MKIYIRRFEKSFYFTTNNFNLDRIQTVSGRDNKLAAEALVDFLTKNPDCQMAGLYVVECREKLFGGTDYNVFYKVA